jgi:hypothetical protein
MELLEAVQLRSTSLCEPVKIVELEVSANNLDDLHRLEFRARDETNHRLFGP